MMKPFARLAGVCAAAVLLALLYPPSPASASHSFTLDPKTGPPGTAVTVKPTSITGNRAYEVYWDFVSAADRGALVALGAGTSPVAFPVPADAAPGEHTVGLCIDCDSPTTHFKTRPFAVTGAAATASPSPPPPTPEPPTPPPPPPQDTPAPTPPPTPATTPTPGPTVSPTASPSPSPTPVPIPTETALAASQTPGPAVPTDDNSSSGMSPLQIGAAVLIGGTVLGTLSAALIVVKTNGLGRSYRPFRRG